MEPVLKYEPHGDGRIVVMTMNRPEAMNSLNADLGAAYDDAWRRFAADDDAWVAIITGAGDRAFCAGGDLKEIRDTGLFTKEGRRQRIAERGGLGPSSLPVSESLNLWKPTIAAINGYCLGGGWRIAQQCDIRIAAEHAEMGVPEVRWNLSANWFADVTRQISLTHALEIIFSPERLTAQRAYEIGWVNKVVPGERLMDEAMAYAERILTLAPRSMRNLKEILYRGYYMEPLTGRAFARALEQNLIGMEDSLEGPRAFAERRKPDFKNR